MAPPDLVYDVPTRQVAVFVDGPVHGTQRPAERDREVEAGSLVGAMRLEKQIA